MNGSRVIRVVAALLVGVLLAGPPASAAERTVLYEHFTSPN